MGNYCSGITFFQKICLKFGPYIRYVTYPQIFHKNVTQKIKPADIRHGLSGGLYVELGNLHIQVIPSLSKTLFKKLSLKKYSQKLIVSNFRQKNC